MFYHKNFVRVFMTLVIVSFIAEGFFIQTDFICKTQFLKPTTCYYENPVFNRRINDIGCILSIVIHKANLHDAKMGYWETD